MPRAGFYAISASRITFGRDGCWYADGEPIVNRRIADLFSRHLRRHPAGGYEIVMGDERARIEVEDTPFVVVSVSGDARRGFTVHLNDGSAEALDPSTLAVGLAEVLYGAVKGGAERARFLRPAYYQLAPFIEESHGRFTLRCRDREHVIAHA